MSAPTRTVNGREATAGRLLRSASAHSSEPGIDRDTPLVGGLWSVPQHRSSLDGTAPGEGRTLTIHEMCRAALEDPHRRESLRWSARKLVPFLRRQGIIGGLRRKVHLV